MIPSKLRDFVISPAKLRDVGIRQPLSQASPQANNAKPSQKPKPSQSLAEAPSQPGKSLGAPLGSLRSDPMAEELPKKGGARNILLNY